MKIWVDGQCFQTGSNVRGIGRYVADLLSGIANADPAVEIIISLNGSMREEAIAARTYLNKAVKSARICIWFGLADRGEFFEGYSEERRTDEEILAAHINSLGVDIALSPSPFEGYGDRASPFIKTKNIKAATGCIFHDAIPHRYPSIYLSEENSLNLYYRRLDCIGSFDVVLCNSAFTEAEYQDIFKKTNSVSIGAGLSGNFEQLVKSWTPESSKAAKLGSYALYVGGLDWRKNVPFLVQAMALLGECQSGALKLVLAGDNHPDLIEPLRKMWVQRGLDPTGLLSTGWVSDADLVDLYKNAAVTIQPSRMEGFGLGALEAMAAGSPFVSAFGGAVAEVVGDEEVFFDPDVAPSLSGLVARILEDKKFAEKRVNAGYLRVSDFTWHKSATIALNSLREIIADRPAESGVAMSAPGSSARRLIIDVSSTAQSPVLSGIQRVMHNLANAVLANNLVSDPEPVLSYCRGNDGWFHLENLQKQSVSLSPFNKIAQGAGDSYLLLDSSWLFIEGQKNRLVDALVMGQEVIHGIHDIGPLTMSAMTDEGMPFAFRRWFEFVLGHSTGIVCVSRAVADEVYELISQLRLPRPMKIGYFRLGADFADVDADYVNLNYPKKRKTFLMVGTIEPRKGHLVAIKAFERLWNKGLDIDLLVVGKVGWDTKQLQIMLERHSELGNRLHWRNGLTDGGLRAAYESSDALVMASYLEGFGLPVVEAGRFGLPVILSDLPVFREVGQGAHWATYFERGDSEGLASAIELFVREDIERKTEFSGWPLWSESAAELTDVLYETKWHKYYEPADRSPNVKLKDVGDTRITKRLDSDEDRRVQMRIIEGPFLSSDGKTLRIAVAIRNLSDAIWSSDPQEGGGLDVNLGYHLYDKRGNCISFDNPRTKIPFVIAPDSEVFLAVRVPTEWLVRGATYATIELVQEGVRWFGNPQKVPLLNVLEPDDYVSKATSDLDPQVRPGSIDVSLFRGPFGDDVDTEQHYLFSVFNGTSTNLAFSAADGRALVQVALKSVDGASLNGIWPIAHFENIAPNSFGYLCVYASTRNISEARELTITIERHETRDAWSIDLLSSKVLYVQQEAAEVINIEAPKETFNNPVPIVHDLNLAFKLGGEIPATRGFYEPEATHCWMRGMEGEIDLSHLLDSSAVVRSFEFLCAPYSELPDPVEMTVFVGDVALKTQNLSKNFMAYLFEMTDDALVEFRKHGHIRVVSNQSTVEQGGERNLSLCLVNLKVIL